MAAPGDESGKHCYYGKWEKLRKYKNGIKFSPALLTFT